MNNEHSNNLISCLEIVSRLKLKTQNVLILQSTLQISNYERAVGTYDHENLNVWLILFRFTTLTKKFEKSFQNHLKIGKTFLGFSNNPWQLGILEFQEKLCQPLETHFHKNAANIDLAYVFRLIRFKFEQRSVSRSSGLDIRFLTSFNQG